MCVCVCVWACQTVAVPIVILHERWVVNHGNCGRPALDKPQTGIKFHSRDLRVRLVQPENDGSFRETPRNTSQDDPDPSHEYSNPMMFSLQGRHCGFQVSPSPPLSSNTANLGCDGSKSIRYVMALWRRPHFTNTLGGLK